MVTAATGTTEHADIDVLLVDDDEEWGATTARLLDHSDPRLTVTFTASAETAMGHVRDGTDCVVSDYDMPGIDGIDLLKLVREDFPDLPFILLTAVGSEAVASEAIAAGVTDYIRKDPGADRTETLRNRVGNAVQSHRARRRVDELNRDLGQLHEAASTIGECETRERIVAETVRAGGRVVGFDATAVAAATDEGFVVRDVDRAATPADGDDPLPGDPLWTGDELPAEDTVFGRAYETGRSVVAGPSEGPFGTESSGLDADRSVLVTPLDEHGLLIGLADTVTENDLELGEILATHASAALDRVASRERLVAERNGKERMRRLLTSASTRVDVTQSVCDYLVDEEGYRLAWVGAVGDDGLSVRAFARADPDDDYVESVLFELAAGDDVTEPGVRAALDGERRVVSDVDPAAGEWARAAGSRGYRGVAAVPLEQRDVRYGTLAVYGGESRAIEGTAPGLLDEYAESVSTVLNRIQVREGLTTDRSMELELTVEDHPLGPLADEWNERLVVDSAIPRGDEVLYQVDLDGPPPEGVRSGGDPADTDGTVPHDDALPGRVVDVDPVADHDDGAHVRVHVRGPTPESILADRGGKLVRTEVDRTATVTATVPRRIDVNATVEAVRELFPDTRLQVKRLSAADTEGRSRELRVWRRVRSDLTDRQFQALRTAYHNGYYERPRHSDTGEVAAMLDISRQTFSQHLRAAERKLVDRLLD